MSSEIEAARIAADAAIQAARIQGEWTLAAGIAALGGGVLTVFGAIIAAGIQVRLEERKHKARVAAYRVRMTEIAVNLDNHAFINDIHAKKDADIIRIELVTVPEELNPSNWSDHAMLGDKAVNAISGLYEMAKLFREFSEEMRGKPAHARSKRFGQPLGDDEAVEPGIDTYRHMNQSLRDRAKYLLSILKP